MPKKQATDTTLNFRLSRYILRHIDSRAPSRPIPSFTAFSIARSKLHPGSREKDPFVQVQSVTVGHAGNIIENPPITGIRGVFATQFANEEVIVLHERVEEVYDDLANALEIDANLWRIVYSFEQKVSQTFKPARACRGSA